MQIKVPRLLHWGILLNIQRRTYINPSQTLPKDCRGENTPSHSKKLSSPWCQNQAKMLPNKKMTGQYLWWLYMQKFSKNINKSNPTRHKKDHAPWSNWIHPSVHRDGSSQSMWYTVLTKDKNHIVISIEVEK